MASSSSSSSDSIRHRDELDKQSTYSIISDYAASNIHKYTKPFVTYRLQTKYEQPWLDDPRLRSRTTRNNRIVYVLLLLGIVAAALYCWTGTLELTKLDYCLVLDEKFKSIDPSVWSYEIQVGGFGNGEFDWTTADADNVYVDKNGLRIVPTLTNETTTITNSQLLHGYTLNLTTAGTCTGETIKACGIRSNSTKGTMINPVRSARISTRGKKGIRYGKVEVEAKLPAGDWIWPAIWMLPQDNVYGIWPASGEIDIMESRGNNYDFPQGGVDYFSSALHWGPYAHTDSYLLTSGSTTIRRTDFSKGFYKFGLVWTEDYIVTYLGNRIHQVMYIKFGEEGFWERGDFVKVNATLDANPWRNAKSKAAPFDQEFYLLLNVAVGSTNGYFKDIPAKPWVDGSGTEMRDFWAGVDEWYPTWGPVEERGMTVRSVKMWQQGKCKR